MHDIILLISGTNRKLRLNTWQKKHHHTKVPLMVWC
uniref:Uncharacterized protein n=1 Tax=Rhizophora mucronata TaxID=61149 RepID=A0A2P2PEW4_RHIMU